MTNNWSVQELTAEEIAALDEENQHHQLPSCQMDNVSMGESDLSLEQEADE